MLEIYNLTLFYMNPNSGIINGHKDSESWPVFYMMRQARDIVDK